MSYLHLAYIHLVTVLIAFSLGTFLLFLKKGTALHKLIGKFFMILMITTAIVSLFFACTTWPKISWPFWLYPFILCVSFIFSTFRLFCS